MIALAAFVLLFVGVMQPVNAVVFVLDGVLMGAGDMRFLAVSMVAAAALFLAAAAVLLATGAGLGWLWTAIGGLHAGPARRPGRPRAQRPLARRRRRPLTCALYPGPPATGGSAGGVPA